MNPTTHAADGGGMSAADGGGESVADGGGMSATDGGTVTATDGSTSTTDGDPVTTQRAPVLLASNPTAGASAIPCAAWLRLDFDVAASDTPIDSLGLECAGERTTLDAAWVTDSSLVLNPRAQLPQGAHCALQWQALDQPLEFDVASSCPSVAIPYDRQAGESLAPFPDDYFLVPDAALATGHRLAIDVPKVDPALAVLLTALITPTQKLDGMSPLAPIVVELPDSPDPTSLPLTAAESLEPTATIGLFELDGDGTELGRRIPFDCLVREAADSDGKASHVLVVFPAVPLTARAHYAFVISNRVRTQQGASLTSSPFLRAALSGSASNAQQQKLVTSLETVLPALAQFTPMIQPDDIALLLSISVRSLDTLANDLLAIRQQLKAAAAPSFTIDRVSADTDPNSDIAAIATGTWRPLSFRSGEFIARDRSGTPTPSGTARLPFTLALPKTAAASPAPVIMYQHGQPGSAEDEVPRAASRGLARAGFAVIGFTDVVNREIIPDGDIVSLNLQAVLTLLAQQDLPDYLSLQTHAEQLALLRLIPSLETIDVLPVGAPDGRPDLDSSAPLGYLGISQGSTHGLGLLAFAPEIHAAALTVGGGRFGATLVHQAADPLYLGVSAVFPGLTHAQFYASLSLVQMAFDRQDSLNLARYMYRRPLALETPARASVLLIEGLGDTLVPYYATRSAAAQLGLPQLEPVAERVPFLPLTSSPVRANIDAATSGSFFQYVPQGYVAAPASPGCAALGQTEGHYCAQIADEALRQRVRFFQSALEAAPPSIEVVP